MVIILEQYLAENNGQYEMKANGKIIIWPDRPIGPMALPIIKDYKIQPALSEFVGFHSIYNMHQDAQAEKYTTEEQGFPPSE